MNYIHINCLNINRELKDEKVYDCKKCNIKMDRDKNASKNILLTNI